MASVTAKHSQTRPGYLFLLPFWSVSARQGPCPGQGFSYSNRTKNRIPVLVIPGSFMEFPGSLHPLTVNNPVREYSSQELLHSGILPASDYYSLWILQSWNAPVRDYSSHGIIHPVITQSREYPSQGLLQPGNTPARYYSSRGLLCSDH